MNFNNNNSRNSLIQILLEFHLTSLSFLQIQNANTSNVNFCNLQKEHVTSKKEKRKDEKISHIL